MKNFSIPGNVHMKPSAYFGPRHLYLLLFILLFLFLAQTPIFAAEYQEDVSNKDYLFVKGLVRNISPEQGTLTITPRDGHSITFILDSKTEFDGFFKLEELKIRQSVKVWYRPEKDRNIVLKILKPMDLGC